MSDTTGAAGSSGDQGSMRVLLVTPDYPPPPGGIQTIVANLEAGLEAAGHEVRVLEFDPNDYRRSVSDFIPRPRWIYSFQGMVTAQFVYQSALYRRVTAAIDAFEPDVVHAMHVREWAAMVAARERSIPTVLSTYALELGERKLASRAIEEANTVHAISDFTAGVVEDVAGSPVSTHIIPPSIDVDAFRKVAEGEAGDDSGPGPVVSMARFVERKNLETVVRAWIDLDRDNPARAGRNLILAGDGPNRERLEAMAAEVDDVHFPGWVNGSEKRELLARADAFVMVPRRRQLDVEGFGIVYIEAQAARCPVIGSKHGGAPEAIGDAGLLVADENDENAVTEAISTLLTDEDRRKACLRAAADRIDRFDIPRVTADHLRVYADLVESDAA